jgi:predicted permease
MKGLMQDVRYAVRRLARTPLTTFIILLILAGGIATNTAVFSVIDALLLRPVAGVKNPKQMVLFERFQSNQMLGSFGYPDYLDYRAQLTTFAGVAAKCSWLLDFSEAGGVERIHGELVTGNYFSLLGVWPLAGRLLDENDVAKGPEATAAVLSAAFWRRKFAGDPKILGRTIVLNGHNFTVVGVTQKDFRGIHPESHTDVWLPITLQSVAIPHLSPDTLSNRASGWLTVLGRLKPGISLKQGQAQVNTVAARLGREYPITNAHRTAKIYRGLGLDPDDRLALGNFLGLLLASVVLLELIACSSVANLLLARAAQQRQEMAVRQALGASRGRLVRMALNEGLVLATASGALGLYASLMVGHWLISFRQPAYALQGLELKLDPRVLFFTLLLTVLTGAIFALPAAWQTARADVVSGLKEGASAGGGPKPRLRAVLVVSQVALSLVLLVGAASTMRAWARALAANPIASPTRVLLVSLDLDSARYSPKRGATLYQSLLTGVRALPGVVSASSARSVPPEEWPTKRSIFYAGQAPPQNVLQGREFEMGIRVDSNAISPGYFQTLGIRVVRGRDFGDSDTADASRVAIINRKLAQRLWPGEDPIGRRIAVPEWEGPERPPATVVGLAEDIRSRGFLSEVPLQLYLPRAQEYSGRSILVVRCSGDPSSMISAIRDEIHGVYGALPLNTETGEQHIASSLWQQRTAASLIGGLGIVALVLAALGLYGVVSYGVTQRGREIGIRMALGAQPRRISVMILREGMMLLIPGAVFGFAAALAASTILSHWIAGVRSFDLVAFATALIVLTAVSLTANYLPARRATRVDPKIALRQE